MCHAVTTFPGKMYYCGNTQNFNLAVLTCMLLGFSGGVLNWCRCVWLWVLSDGPHFVCLYLSCSFLNTTVFTFTLLSGIIKCYHILHMHMYSIWDLLKTGMSYCPLWYQDNLHMCFMYSLMYASIIKNLIWYLRGKCNTIFYSVIPKREKKRLWYPGDAVHVKTLEMGRALASVVVFCWIVFHTVPSLQQNIHIKTLADDMVRCLV